MVKYKHPKQNQNIIALINCQEQSKTALHKTLLFNHKLIDYAIKNKAYVTQGGELLNFYKFFPEYQHQPFELRVSYVSNLVFQPDTHVVHQNYDWIFSLDPQKLINQRFENKTNEFVIEGYPKANPYIPLPTLGMATIQQQAQLIHNEITRSGSFSSYINLYCQRFQAIRLRVIGEKDTDAKFKTIIYKDCPHYKYGWNYDANSKMLIQINNNAQIQRRASLQDLQKKKLNVKLAHITKYVTKHHLFMGKTSPTQKPQHFRVKKNNFFAIDSKDFSLTLPKNTTAYFNNTYIVIEDYDVSKTSVTPSFVSLKYYKNDKFFMSIPYALEIHNIKSNKVSYEFPIYELSLQQQQINQIPGVKLEISLCFSSGQKSGLQEFSFRAVDKLTGLDYTPRYKNYVLVD